MDKKKSTQEFELTDCIVWVTCCLIAFFTEYSYTDMRSLNHIDIIGTISYGQSNSLGVMFFDHIDHLCFLAWWGTAHYYSMALPQYF